MTPLKTFAALAAVFVLAAPAALAREAQEKHFTNPSDAPTVAIGGGGTALVRGATITAVGDNDFTAKTQWGSGSLTWNVETDGDTDFVATDGDAQDFPDFKVGEVISFSGSLTGALSVDATTVREWSAEDQEDGDDHGKKNGWSRPFLNFFDKFKFHFDK